jgi:hypothetical protein
MLIVELEGSPIQYETAQEGTGDESWHSRR